MRDIMKLARVQLFILPIFIFLKLVRPSVLDNSSPEIFKVILRSAPSFFESVIGTFVLTGIGLILNDRLHEKIQPKFANLMTLIITAVFVTTQELNIYNIRGNNTLDPNDLIFSMFGLIVGYLIVLQIKPRIHNE